MGSRENYCMFILRIPHSLFWYNKSFLTDKKKSLPIWTSRKHQRFPFHGMFPTSQNYGNHQNVFFSLFQENKMKSVEYICLKVAFLIIVLMDLVGNTLVILVIRLTKTMRPPMNMLLLNLAVADMVVAVFVAIQFVIGPTFEHPSGTTGLWLCKFITGGTITWSAAAVSVGNLVAISIERWICYVSTLL